MAEEMLDEFRVDAATKEEGGAGVPEVVEANIRETGTFQERLEVTIHHVLGVERGTLDGGENEVGILVERPGLELLL